jgi:SAM-dependent methyltransferase
LALKQHKDDGVRYDQQVENSKEYVMPFIEKTKPVKAGMKVLEIGCGEGGVLAPFIERGCICIGVDLDEPRIVLANNFFAKEVAEGKVQFLYKNVYDDDFLQQHRNAFDLIILKDTIEHIPEQEKFIPYLKNLLAEGGQVFFGFPPWYMPFGGHQQVCQSKIGSKLPYYHILPRGIYKSLLKMMGEDDRTIIALMEVYDTRITIERFEKIVKNSGFKVKSKQHYLFNPIYRYSLAYSRASSGRL